MYKVDLEKAKEPEIKMPTFVGSQKKPENSRKTSASLTTLNALTVDHNKLWKILKEMEIADHHTCLMQNLYASQEATVRTGHGKMDWFKIGKAVHQGLFKITLLFKKQRCYFAYKGLYSQNYGFSSSCVRMWELDIKKG